MGRESICLFNFCTVNLNSLINKLQYVANLCAINKLDVLSVTETWLTNSCSSSFVVIPGFRFYRGDVRGEVRKHGSGLYVSDKINHTQIEVSIPNVVVVHLLDLGVHVVSIYRPPSYSNDENVQLLQFLKFYDRGRELIVMGDFNLPYLSWPADSTSGYISDPSIESFMNALLSVDGINGSSLGPFILRVICWTLC